MHEVNLIGLITVFAIKGMLELPAVAEARDRAGFCATRSAPMPVC
jgi:hypothetical protein